MSIVSVGNRQSEFCFTPSRFLFYSVSLTLPSDYSRYNVKRGNTPDKRPTVPVCKLAPRDIFPSMIGCCDEFGFTTLNQSTLKKKMRFQSSSACDYWFHKEGLNFTRPYVTFTNLIA